MKAVVKKIYQLVVPLKFRKKIDFLTEGKELQELRQNIVAYYANLPEAEITEEQIEAVTYLKNNPVTVFPYPFEDNYPPSGIRVYLDKSKGLHYVLLNGKKLYYKRSWKKKWIRNSYSFLSIEQDVNSPHRYLTDSFTVAPNDVVVDVGAAEGIFALSVVEDASKLYLFETDEEWIEALEATFAPWKDKVQIINKFVSDKNDEQHVTLDAFFADNQPVDFLKIDVDGAEAELLAGAEKLITTKESLKVAICTYHKQQDEAEFTKLLATKGFQVSPSKGYMLFMYGDTLEAPYLRRGLLRATK